MIDSDDPPELASCPDETTPLGVFLAKSDSTEEKLLFRFPYVIEEPKPSIQLNQSRFALIETTHRDDRPAIGSRSPGMADNTASGSTERTTANTTERPLLPAAYTELSTPLAIDPNDQREITKVIGLTDAAFSNLFGAVKHKLCDQKFELKVDNVRFVGHPTVVAKHCFHVVFGLKANAPHDVIQSYHELSQQIAIALRSEEIRCRYFSRQSDLMVACHDKIGRENAPGKYQSQAAACTPYKSILEESQLAKELKTIFVQLCTDGIVNVKINHWINLNFCLSQKVHRKLMASPSAPPITPANIQLCLKKLRPYHTFLLLVDHFSLLESLPQDLSPTFIRLVRASNPLKNLLELSADADITLSQSFSVVAQLVYWGKATVIFPLCESNHYILHPSAPTGIDSKANRQFQQQFPNESLPKMMSKFSLGVTLGQFKNPMNSADQECKFVQMIIWMLKRRLLLQTHMYVMFVPLENGWSSRFRFHIPDSGSPSMTEPSSISKTIDTITEQSNENSPPITVKPPLPPPSDSTIKESSELILRGAGLLPEEIEKILTIPASENLDDIRMFSKLIPYFDGHHHIEDIMYYENLRRSHLLTLIDKFRDVLIVCQYEDTTVAELLPYSTL